MVLLDKCQKSCIKKMAVLWTLKHEDKTHSCISKHFKTFISGAPEPLASDSTKSGLDKENFIKSLLLLRFFSSLFL